MQKMDMERTPDRATGDMDDPMKLAANSVHLVRNLQLTNVAMTRLADAKANILLAASSVVFTVTLTQVREGGHMLLPLVILAIAGLFSAICAILAAKPTITKIKGNEVPDDANILFFGIYTALGEEEFIERMLPRLRSDEAAYRTMLRDIYQNGSVLQHKKYRWLDHGYTIFLVGLLMAGLAATWQLITR
jgi:hypothetical protein